MVEKGLNINSDSLLYCKVCGDRVEKELNFPIMDGFGGTKKMKVHCICSCQQAKREKKDKQEKFEEEMRRIEYLRRVSIMDVKLRNVDFSTFNTDQENEKLFRIAKNYVKNFDKMFANRQGILFYGNVGTGKSYIAAMIANELINRLNSVIMTSFIKLLQDIGNFDTNDGEYINRLNSAKLLIIDDLGAERSTDFALEKVYDIIDSRYRSGKPIILTTNLNLGQMKECDDIKYNRIYDRIFEMCYPVKVEGLSWRKREAASRFKTTKSILEE